MGHVHEMLLAQERDERIARENRQRLITRYNIREAAKSLPEGHPAAKKLAEALALLEE